MLHGLLSWRRRCSGTSSEFPGVGREKVGGCLCTDIWTQDTRTHTRAVVRHLSRQRTPCGQLVCCHQSGAQLVAVLGLPCPAAQVVHGTTLGGVTFTCVRAPYTGVQ